MQNTSPHLTLPFDHPIPNGGYAWWYVDVISEDPQTTLTIIFLIGNVFSPRYFKTRHKRGMNQTSPLDFPAVNISLRNKNKHLWSFTEWPSQSLQRSKAALSIGTSSMRWDNGMLIIQLQEKTKPFFERMDPEIIGTIKIQPTHIFDRTFTLDSTKKHKWYPMAPHASAEVHLQKPQLRFSGSAYHDGNSGQEPIEKGFCNWTWSRTERSEGTSVVYETTHQTTLENRGQKKKTQLLEILFKKNGHIEKQSMPLQVKLPKATWGIERKTRTDYPSKAHILQTLEASPFYARSLIETFEQGYPVTHIHESLDLNRFQKPWVRFLLPWKIRKEKI